MLPIVKAPNEVLSALAKPVSTINKDVLSFVEEMKQTLAATSDPEGVGLAAPQVGKSLQIFIAKPTVKSPFLVFINPKIIAVSDEMQELKRPRRVADVRGLPTPLRQGFARQSSTGGKETSEGTRPKRGKLEGCLSLVNIWGTVKRHAKLTLFYLDQEGKAHTKEFSNFLATIIQHEVDHLEGILFPKRVLEQQGKLYRSHKNEKGEDEFEEIEI